MKIPGPREFTPKFHKTFKEELTLIVLKHFYETERKETLPHSFYEASVKPIPKLDKDTTEKENYSKL
jgi:hypothetical protein